MADPRPTVTVCIPTLGRASLWERALPSVLAQADDVHQVVVALDRSVAPEVASSLDDERITTVVHDRPGVCGARNAAAAAATGDLLYFLDDDDLSVDGGLGALRDLIDGPDVVLASGAVEVHRQDGTVEEVRAPANRGGVYFHVEALFNAGTFVVRRWCFERVGGYEEDLQFGENFELGMRLGKLIHDEQLATARIDQVVLHWVRSPTQYGPQPARTAAFLLDRYGDRFDAFPAERADYDAILGVRAWRDGQRRTARWHFRRAARSAPRTPAHWGRVAVAMVSPVADRLWSEA